ncbi:MAG TPA: DUF6152 family protein [Terriglobia bacterium]|nr:DUF6152 family protein [Terriglobia bacterium]
MTTVTAIIISLFLHHATAVQYDVGTVVTLKGTITRIDWVNPHIHIYIDVKSNDGSLETWTVEGPSPGATIVAGLSKKLLASGTVVSFDAFPSKSGSPHAVCAKAVTLPDGNRFTFLVGI